MFWLGVLVGIPIGVVGLLAWVLYETLNVFDQFDDADR